MKITLTVAALALSLAPAVAFAQCNQSKGDTASSCLPGYSWDPVKATCVATPSS